jgi:hypothetical protein
MTACSSGHIRCVREWRLANNQVRDDIARAIRHNRSPFRSCHVESVSQALGYRQWQSDSPDTISEERAKGLFARRGLVGGYTRGWITKQPRSLPSFFDWYQSDLWGDTFYGDGAG